MLNLAIIVNYFYKGDHLEEEIEEVNQHIKQLKQESTGMRSRLGEGDLAKS
jgi:hypothetical protein